MEILQIDTQISLQWLLASAGTIIGIVGAAWLSMKLNVATIMVKITQLEKDIISDRKSVETLKQDNKDMFLRIESKLDRILEKQGEQSVELANKQDKKN